MASVKRFVSLQFLNPKAVGRTPWAGDQPVTRPLPTQDNTNRINANIHTSSGIRAHDPSVQGSEDSSCPRPREHCDHQWFITYAEIHFFFTTFAGIAQSINRRAMGWTAWVQFPAVQDFSLLHSVQTDSWANPAYYPMGTGASFPGGKAAGAWSWPLIYIYCRRQERWSYTSAPTYVFMALALNWLSHV
jgi:hypothetical protein